MSEVLAYTTQMLKRLTEHIQQCKSHDCCVKELVNDLDFEKSSVGHHAHTRTANHPTTGDYDNV